CRDVTSEHSGLRGGHWKSSSSLIPPWMMQLDSGIGDSSGANLTGGLFDGVDLSSVAVAAGAAAQGYENQMGQRHEASSNEPFGDSGSGSGSSDNGDSEASTHIDEDDNDNERDSGEEGNTYLSDTAHSDCGEKDEGSVTHGDSDLEKETVHMKKVFIPKYEERKAGIINGNRRTAEYMLPSLFQMPQDTSLNQIRRTYFNDPTRKMREKYKNYIDRKGGICWKEASRVLKYAEAITSEFLAHFKGNNRFYPNYSTRYYYGKKIHSLYPQYRFSICKKVFAYFEKQPLNPITELFRDDYLEDDCVEVYDEMKFRSYSDIIYIFRSYVLKIIRSIKKSIRDLEAPDMRCTIDAYRKRYRTSIEKTDGIYAEDHPYIIALTKIDEYFEKLQETLSKGRYIIQFYDYKMDSVLRTYASQLSYSHRFVHYWLHIISRLFLSGIDVWELPPEIHYETFKSYGNKKNFVVTRNNLIRILYRYKTCTEDGTYKPHIYRDMNSLTNAYSIYKYTRIFYDQLCEGFENLLGQDIIRVNDIFKEICIHTYTKVPSMYIQHKMKSIIRLVYSKDPPCWLSIYDLKNLIFDDESDGDFSSPAESFGLLDSDDEEKKIRELEYENERKNRSKHEEYVERKANAPICTDGTARNSLYNCYESIPDTFKNPSYNCDGVVSGSTENTSTNYCGPILCIMDIPRHQGGKEVSEPEENTSHESSTIVDVVKVTYDENGYAVEEPLENVQDNLEVATQKQMEVASSNLEFLDLEPVETAENNSAFLAREPVAEAQNGFIFSPKESVAPAQNGFIFSPKEQVAPSQNGFIFSPREPVAATQNGFIFSPQETVAPTQNGFIFSPKEPVVPSQNGFIFSPREPVACTQNGFIFSPQDTLAPTQNSFTFSAQEPLAPVQTRGGFVQGAVGAVHNSSNFWSQEPAVSVQNHGDVSVQEPTWTLQNSGTFM
ncbi:conserved Plasmodium protein, unknown function, partial [Plasmodium vivax]